MDTDYYLGFMSQPKPAATGYMGLSDPMQTANTVLNAGTPQDAQAPQPQAAAPQAQTVAQPATGAPDPLQTAKTILAANNAQQNASGGQQAAGSSLMSKVKAGLGKAGALLASVPPANPPRQGAQAQLLAGAGTPNGGADQLSPIVQGYENPSGMMAVNGYKGFNY